MVWLSLKPSAILHNAIIIIFYAGWLSSLAPIDGHTQGTNDRPIYICIDSYFFYQHIPKPCFHNMYPCPQRRRQVTTGRYIYHPTILIIHVIHLWSKRLEHIANTCQHTGRRLYTSHRTLNIYRVFSNHCILIDQVCTIDFVVYGHVCIHKDGLMGKFTLQIFGQIPCPVHVTSNMEAVLD